MGNELSKEGNYHYRYKCGLIVAGFMRNIKLKQDIPIDMYEIYKPDLEFLVKKNHHPNEWRLTRRV